MSGGAHRAETTWSRHGRLITALTLCVVVVAAGLWWVLTPSSPSAPTRATPLPPAEVEVDMPQLGNATQLARGNETSVEGNRLIIDAIGVDAPVDATGVADGEMVLPEDVSRVAWLNTGAAPGDMLGASIVSGHISDTSDRPGAMWDLDKLEPGDLVRWVWEGREWVFVVTGKATYPRSGDLPEELFDTEGERALFVVTCTNRQTTDTGGFHYADNLVLITRPYGAISG